MKVRRLAAFGNLLLAALLMLAVWVLIVWVASRPALKALIDLTPQKVSSVDPVTEDLLRELRAQKVEIEFHLFYPPSAGQGQNDAEQQASEIRRRLRDLTQQLLKTYQFLGGEMVTIRHHDFYADATSTREAVQKFDYKAAEQEVLVVAVRQPGKELRFRKLSLVSDLAVIDLPNLQSTTQPARMPVPVLKNYKGEEAISSALKSLLVQGTPVAYFLQGYSPLVDFKAATAMGYSGLRAALERLGFDVRDLNLRQTSGVPTDAAMVLVIEPNHDFAERDATALFEYVKRGGRVFVNYSWAATPDLNPDGGRFGELLGYELGTAPVFHLIPDPNGRAGGRGLDGNDGVAKLQLRVNPLHPTTRRLAEAGRPFEVAGARELRERPGAPGGVRREPLLQTGDEAWLALPGPDGFPSNRAPQIQLHSFLVGMAFELDAGATASGDNTKAPAAPKTGQVVVVSGAFCNNIGMPLFGGFALNVCNWMAERRVLLDIQGSRYEAHHLQLQPQQFQRVWYLLFYGVPGTFLLLGLLVVYLRRRV